MGPENSNDPVVAYIDGQPMKKAEELTQFTTAHMENGEIMPDTSGFSVGALKFDMELDQGKMAAVLDAFKAIATEISREWEQIIKTVQKTADAILRGYELERAIRLSAAYNPRLVHFYRRTKKRRIRKKYAKRILAWYREEVCGCYD